MEDRKADLNMQDLRVVTQLAQKEVNLQDNSAMKSEMRSCDCSSSSSFESGQENNIHTQLSTPS